MIMSQTYISLPGVCAGCGAPVLCDDPHKVQTVSKRWWHIQCHDEIHAEPARIGPTPRPIDPVNVLVWLIIFPVSGIAWLWLIIYTLFFA